MKNFASHFITYNPVLKDKKEKTQNVIRCFHTWAKNWANWSGAFDIPGSNGAAFKHWTHPGSPPSTRHGSCCPVLFWGWEKALCSQTIVQEPGKWPTGGLDQEATFPLRKNGLSPLQELFHLGAARQVPTARSSCKQTEVIKQSSTKPWRSQPHKTSIIYT